jgi:hypothetical protein
VRGGSAAHTALTASRTRIPRGSAVVGACDKLHDIERIDSGEAHYAGRIEAAILPATASPGTGLGITARIVRGGIDE